MEETMTDAHETIRELREPALNLRHEVPDVIGAYATMQRAVMVGGALPAKVKELIALAVSAARQCDGCIAAHARSVARQQEPDGEVAEAMGVVVMMNGGPGTVWGPRAFAAYQEISAERQTTAS
jgi:AhpD family alkylhydroperoxidase